MNTLTKLSRLFLVLAAVLLAGSIFVAIWRIELAAPQYPEGLALLIYADKIGGDVDIINGLNHYIGMQTLHTENFIEFTILPYIIGFFSLVTLLAAILNRKKLLYTLFSAFVAFGVLAMVDFYRWNYNYGHNLDPNAAIKVPGMAYQPPLIGYKQLLNFGAYSVPDIGGWLFIGAGLLMLAAVIVEIRLSKKQLKPTFVMLILVSILSFTSCTDTQPKLPKLNVDQCDYCKMTIANDKFFAACTTKKGRLYTFDDMSCMVQFIEENKTIPYDNYYVVDFLNPNHFIKTDLAVLIQNETFKSPMGGNVAAFSNVKDAEVYGKDQLAKKINWLDLLN
ncbi:MAG: nitrous oxide reductase accessory protein NosL [Bacteroidota bacterium]